MFLLIYLIKKHVIKAVIKVKILILFNAKDFYSCVNVNLLFCSNLQSFIKNFVNKIIIFLLKNVWLSNTEQDY